MKRELLLIIAGASALLVSGVASAKATNFDVSGHKVSMDMPEGFRPVTNIVNGLPLMVNGPAAGEEHPVLNVMFATNQADKIKFDSNGENAAYKEGREAWVAQQNGKALEFFPYAKVDGAKAEVYSMGYRYQLASNEYVERTYYARCGSKLFYFQSHMTPATQKASGAKMDQLVKSFKCE